MESRRLQEFVHFSEEGARRATVFETDRLWCEVVCLDRNQSFGPVGDADSDVMATIVAGEAVFLVDRRRQRLSQWGVVLVPAGAELFVKNASVDPLVLMLTAAPPPVRRTVTG